MEIGVDGVIRNKPGFSHILYTNTVLKDGVCWMGGGSAEDLPRIGK